MFPRAARIQTPQPEPPKVWPKLNGLQREDHRYIRACQSSQTPEDKQRETPPGHADPGHAVSSHGRKRVGEVVSMEPQAEWLGVS